MAKKKTEKSPARKKKQPVEPDTYYVLKIVIFLVLGSLWIRIEHLPDWSIPIPVGLILGLVFASHDHFQIDRKIEYLVLILAAFIAFWLPFGISLVV